MEDAAGAGHAGPEAPHLPPHGGEAVGRGGLHQPALTVQLGDGGVAGDLAQRVGLLGRCRLVSPHIPRLGLAESPPVSLHHPGPLRDWELDHKSTSSVLKTLQLSGAEGFL